MRTLTSWQEHIKAVRDQFEEDAVAGALAVVSTFSGGQNTVAGRNDLALEWQRRGCRPEGVWAVIEAADKR